MEGCTTTETTKPKIVSQVFVKQEVYLESEYDPSSSSDDRGGPHCISGAWTPPTFPKIKEEIESDSPSSDDDLEMNNHCTPSTSIPDNFPKMKEEIKDELEVLGIQEHFQDNSDMFTASNIIFEYNDDSSEPLSSVPSTFKNETCFENNNLKITKRINQTETEIISSSSPRISDQQSINKEKLCRDKMLYIKNHKCDSCGKCFLSNARLSSHLLIHSEEKSHKLKSDTNGHTETPLTCKLRGNGVKKNECPKARTYTPSEERLFKCEFCGKGFIRKAYLITHIQTHGEETPFKCEICGRACKRKYDLHKHRQTHNKERQSMCELCGKDLKNKLTLKSHMSTHSEEKPFKCEICGKYLKLKNSLVKHIQTHSEEKPFKCEFCGKFFRCKANFTMHEQSHIERLLVL